MAANPMGFDQLTRVRVAALYSNLGIPIAVQYFYSSIPESSRPAFESGLFTKVSEEAATEACQYENYIAVFRAIEDLFLVLVGDTSTNELLFGEILDTLESAMSLVFRKPNSATVDGQLENFLLILDETFHEGFVFEGNGVEVAARVQLKDSDAGKGKSGVQSGINFLS
jgi:hypothetical protein